MATRVGRSAKRLASSSNSSSSSATTMAVGRAAAGAGRRRLATAAAATSNISAAATVEAAGGGGVRDRNGSGGGDGSWILLGKKSDLDCDTTLSTGQTFTWKRRADGDWVGVIRNYVVRVSRQGQTVRCKVLNDRSHSREELWADSDDDKLGAAARKFKGLRVLRQDPTECLFAFICSSNNNIPRITSLVTKLKAHYGVKLFTDSDGEDHFTFPTVDALAQAEESHLRELGFGYRAKFIVNSAKKIEEKGGQDFLLHLRMLDLDTVREELVALPGIGRKVADCVALFSLDQHECVPVDTHMWQIAIRDYDPTLKDTKSLTTKTYDRIAKIFTSLHRPRAGWAHCVLFAGELPTQQRKSPASKRRNVDAEVSSAAVGVDAVEITESVLPAAKKVRSVAAKKEVFEEKKKKKRTKKTLEVSASVEAIAALPLAAAETAAGSPTEDEAEE